MKSKNLSNLLLTAFSGLIICMIIGFMIAGTNIINPRHLSFQFTLIGLLGSLLYATSKYYSTKDYIFVLIFFIVFDVIIFYSGSIVKFTIHGINAIFIALAIFLYTKKLEQNNKTMYLSNIFSMSAIISFALIFAVLIFSLIPDYKFEYSFLEGQAFYGLLIGFGLGTGIHIHSKFLLNVDVNSK